MIKQDIFTDEFLEEIGFKLLSLENDPYSKKEPIAKYGKAADKRTNGMTILQWNTQGASCTYFGDKLEANTYLGVMKDGGTRTAFSGYVFSQDDVRKILSLTW